MKILMLSEFFFPFDRGGSEWSVYFLAKQLVRKGNDVTILTPNFGSKSVDNVGQAHIHRFPFYLKLRKKTQVVSPIIFTSPLWWVFSGYGLYKEIIQNKPQVIHVQGKYYLPIAVVLGKLFSIPTIVTFRDYITLCPYGFCINKHTAYQACSLKDTIIKDRATFVDRYVEKSNLGVVFYTYLSAIFGWVTSKILKFFANYCESRIGVSKKLTQVYAANGIKVNQTIYNTVDFSQTTQPGKPQWIVYIGRFTSGKGIDLLLKAYSHASGLVSVPPLYLIGEGKLTKRALIKGITHVGRVPYKRLGYYLNRAYMTVVPSNWEEPFGRVALESLLHNVPVVVSNRGGLPENVTHKKTGFIVEPTPKALSYAMRHVYTDHPHYVKEIKRNYNKLKTKFMDEPVSQYIKLYKTLI